MYSLTLSACTSLARRAASGPLTEVGEGGKWNLATTPPGLLQRELQGWATRQVNFSSQLRYGTVYATNWGLPRALAFEVCGPPAGTSTVLPAMASGAFVEVGS